MAFSRSFNGVLDNLFRQRTHWLRKELGKTGAGKPPSFGRKKVSSGIRKLQAIASDALTHRLAKSEFNQHVPAPTNYHVRGRGAKEKKARFEKWFSERFGRRKGFIYAFWRRKKCLYVGRTGSRGSRPSSHMDKFWFPSVSRITIYAVRSRSHIPKLECLAIHRFRPTYNANKAATKKWTKACPLCTTHKYIERELRSIFRFK